MNMKSPPISNDGSDSSDSAMKSRSINGSASKKSLGQRKSKTKSSTGSSLELVPKKKRRKVVSVCLTNCRYDVVRRICTKLGFKEVGDHDNWNLYWTDLSISIERCKEMKRFQKINHFPGMLEICRKDLLARNLNRMHRLFPKDYTFFPKTWCLPADLGEVLTYSRLHKSKTFILKPDAGSQGKGIFITKNLKEIKPSDRMICQVYLNRPFLIDGYKFDLRVYTLITTCDPLRVYVYNEGLVRFATSRYKEPSTVNISNIFMHLTNYAVNKHSRTYSIDSQAGSKRKLTWFNEYMKNCGYDVTRLWKRIDDVIIKTVISAYPVLRHSYMACFPNHDVIPACCELLGTDILLDRRLNPHILEMNHSPSFHTDTELDCNVKEALLEDMFKMMNLERCDKHKIIKEDRKRVRERLLQGLTKEPPRSPDPRKFNEFLRYEMEKRGNFRLVYPNGGNEQIYAKFFNQLQGSTLYMETSASKARESAAAQIREELASRARTEIPKRTQPIVPKPQKESSSKPPTPLAVPKRNRTSPLTAKNSFEPQVIVESEEKARIARLEERAALMKAYGMLEYLYLSMKKNGVLRPQDEKRYQIFKKVHKGQKVENSLERKKPEITDLLEDITSGKVNSKFQMKNTNSSLQPNDKRLTNISHLNNT